jgi:ketosteroid isomerase-like protein
MPGRPGARSVVTPGIARAVSGLPVAGQPDQNSDQEGLKMSANGNAEVVRRAYEAFNAADMETLAALFDESGSWHTPGRSPIAGDFQGRKAAFAQFGRYGGDTQGTFRAELKTVTADGDGRVVGIHHNSGERNGKQLDVDCCIVFEVADGRIVDGREHFDDLYAWDEFWS